MTLFKLLIAIMAVMVCTQANASNLDTRIRFVEDYHLIDQIALLDTAHKNDVLCLALNIYREAPATGYRSNWAIAATTVNRVKDKDYPDTICDVVYEHKGKQSQFSWTTTRLNRQKPKDLDTWTKDQQIAYNVVQDQESLTFVDTQCQFDHFHDKHTSVKWKHYACKENIDGLTFYQLN